MKKVMLLISTVFIIALGTTSIYGEQKVLGLALASDTNPFYIAMRKGVEMQAGKLNWTVRVVNANEDVNKQVNGVMDLVAQGVTGILISPIDAVATGPAFEAAYKAGIPIISIARGAKSKYQTLFVAMDQIQIGKDIAAWSAKAAGGKGKVAMIAGPAGANVFRDLADGFRSEMTKHPGMTIVYGHTVPLTREQGLKNAEDILVAHPDIRVIYAANDELALGAAQAVAAAGKKKNIIITGLNGIPPALKAVMQGKIDMTVVLNPVAWGILGVKTMDAYLKGERTTQKVFIKHILAVKNNAGKYLPPKKK